VGALSDEDPLIRSTAAWALGRCAFFLPKKDAATAARELKKALEDKKALRSAAWALKRFGIAPDTE
jgi:HEAT repeat protein